VHDSLVILHMGAAMTVAQLTLSHFHTTSNRVWELLRAHLHSLGAYPLMQSQSDFLAEPSRATMTELLNSERKVFTCTAVSAVSASPLMAGSQLFSPHRCAMKIHPGV